jgi:hypothetical protein
MKRFSIIVVLFISLLFFHVFPLQAAADRIQITSASVICGKSGDGWGASYTISADYTANGHRIINEILVVGSGGGRTDVWHHVDAGSGTVTGSEGLWGGFWTGYPYTIDLVMDLYAATTLTYVSGTYVYNGPLVARSTAAAVCTQEGPTEVTISESVPDPGFNPDDGRLQPDAAAPVAVYCQDYGIDVYRINADSTGSLAFTATNEAIDAVGDSPVANTLIAADDNIRLYRLTTGEFQINAGPDAEGKEYVLIWDDC